MNQKRQGRNDSPQDQRRNSSDSKRGIFTSIQPQKLKPNVIPYLQQSLSHPKQIHLLPPRSNQSIYLNSSYTNNSTHLLPPPIHHSHIHNHTHQPRSVTPTKVQFVYPQAATSQLNIPAYGSQHVIQGGLGRQVQYVPIESNRDKMEIRRTVVPVHITNQIPAKFVVNSMMPSTPQYQPYQGHNGMQQTQNDEAYQILLKQYQKLYQRLTKQQLHNQHLQSQLTTLQTQTHPHPSPSPIHPTPTPNPTITTQHKYSLNMKQLHDRLFKIYKKMVDDVIRKKKEQSQEELRGIFGQVRKEIGVGVTVVQESTRVYRRT